MISLILNNKEKIGHFKSYKAIGEYLAENGKTGKYYALPKNIINIAGIKEINIKKYWDKYNGKWEREIEMDGSYY